uniref:Uncharacterized protein n=1 Tax=Serinus canaria TaxID=9135 RepID=A0A8C9NCP1_SERCA
MATALLLLSFELQQEPLLQNDKECIYFVAPGAVLPSWNGRGVRRKARPWGGSSRCPCPSQMMQEQWEGCQPCPTGSPQGPLSWCTRRGSD